MMGADSVTSTMSTVPANTRRVPKEGGYQHFSLGGLFLPRTRRCCFEEWHSDGLSELFCLLWRALDCRMQERPDGSTIREAMLKPCRRLEALHDIACSMILHSAWQDVPIEANPVVCDDFANCPRILMLVSAIRRMESLSRSQGRYMALGRRLLTG